MRSFLLFFLVFLITFTGYSQCTTAGEGQFPSTTFAIPNSCINQTITASAWTDEYSVLSGILAGNTYVFASSVSTDFITIADGTTPIVFGTTPLTFTFSSVPTNLRFYRHDNNTCPVSSEISRTVTVQCTTCTPPSSSTSQPSTGVVTGGTINNQILRLNVPVCGSSSVTSLNFSTTGSTNPTTDIASAKVFYTTSTTFSTTTQFGSTVVAPNGNFTVTGSQSIASGTGYFWLVYDLNCGAVGTNVIDAACNSYVLNGSTIIPSPTNPAGTRTITAATTTITTTQPSTATVTTGTIDNQILRVQVTSCAGSVVTALNLATTGSTNPATDITNAKVYFTTTTTFSTLTLFGTFSSPSGAFTVNGSQALVSGTGYFWLVYDVPVSATGGNVLDAACPSVIKDGGTFTPTTANPTGTRTIVAPPINDNCSGAISFSSVPTDGSCITLSNQSTVGATQSQVACMGTANDDVWFSFVASSTSISVELTNVSGSTDRTHQIFSGSCGSLTSITCSDPETSTTSGLTIGTTYYIRVHDYFSGNSVFNICLKTPPLPPDCASSPVLNCDVTSNAVFAAGSGAWSVSACGFSTLGLEKVYRFTPTTTGAHQLEITAASGGYVDYFYKAASAGCDNTGWICIDDNNATGVDPIGTLTAGTEYYIMLDPELATSTPNHTFKIVCPTLCPTPSLVSSNTVTATSANITWSCTSCTGTFVVEYGIPGFTPGTGSTLGGGLGIVLDPASPAPLAGLDPGSLYDVYVRQDCGGAGFGSNSTKYILETLPPVPVNDACAGAITVTSGSMAATGSTLAATNVEMLTPCSAGGGGAAGCPAGTGTCDFTRGVWFKYTSTGAENITFDTDGSLFDTELQIFSGACGSLTCVAGDDDGGLDGTDSKVCIVSTASFAPVDYYIYLDGHLSNVGTYVLNISAAPLPITISKISAHNMGKNNMITWTTSSEVNNDVQMVERSKDGISGWEMVGKVNGTNSRETVTYEVYDNNPYNTSFYRVHSVDFDGKEQFSKIVSVQREGRSGIITSIQPNPTANFVEIDLQPEFDGDITYTILDVTGKLLKTAVFSANNDALNTHMLDMSDLQSGLYFVTIQGGGINQNAKILKQ